MLQSVSFNHFKSYRSATLPLASLTMLIGANASGKSNAIEGVRLLSWLAQGNRLSAIQTMIQESDQLLRGRVQDLGHHASSCFELACIGMTPDESHLNIGLSVLDQTELHVAHESIHQVRSASVVPLYMILQAATGMNHDVQVEYNHFSSGGHKPKIVCSDQYAIFTQLDSPVKFQSQHKLSQKIIPDVTMSFRTWLSNILFLDPVPGKMRDYHFINERKLLGDGRNLSSVLYHLWGGDGPEEGLSAVEKSNRSSILSFIRSLPEQDIETVGFLSGPRGEVMLQLTETFGQKTRACDASLLSDGTLRVLAMAAAMLSAPEGGMVVIEEIDNGVHPSRAALLLDQIATIAQRRSLRVLLSSHNPALLDALPDSAVPDVVFCYRDPENGSSRLVRLEDVPDYPALIAQGQIGHLLTTGILDRFVKNHPGTEVKKQKAVEWLQQLQSQIHTVSQEG